MARALCAIFSYALAWSVLLECCGLGELHSDVECDTGCCELGELHSSLPAGNMGRGPFGGMNRSSSGSKLIALRMDYILVKVNIAK